MLAGKAERRIHPAARESSMHVSIALVSIPNSENSCPHGGVAPRRRSITQSKGRCGGSEVARALLKTSQRSWYSAGRCEASSEPIRRCPGAAPTSGIESGKMGSSP
jgi:hypothetical protein